MPNLTVIWWEKDLFAKGIVSASILWGSETKKKLKSTMSTKPSVGKEPPQVQSAPSPQENLANDIPKKEGFFWLTPSDLDRPANELHEMLMKKRMDNYAEKRRKRDLNPRPLEKRLYLDLDSAIFPETYRQFRYRFESWFAYVEYVSMKRTFHLFSLFFFLFFLAIWLSAL